MLDETLGDLLRRIAGTVPDQLALFGTHDERRWTSAKLFPDSEAAARAPLARFQPGERIAIWAQNVPEWVLAEFALGIAELPIATVNSDLGAQEAAYVLDPGGLSLRSTLENHRVEATAMLSRTGLRAEPADASTRSTSCYAGFVTTTITQRELRNSSGDIMRRLDAGETFIVTRAGKPVGELSPFRRQRFVTADTVADLFHLAPAIDLDRFRADLDAVADAGIDPRA